MSQFNGRRINPPDTPSRYKRGTPRASADEKAAAVQMFRDTGDAILTSRRLAAETGVRRDPATIRAWSREGEKA